MTKLAELVEWLETYKKIITNIRLKEEVLNMLRKKAAKKAREVASKTLADVRGGPVATRVLRELLPLSQTYLEMY